MPSGKWPLDVLRDRFAPWYERLDRWISRPASADPLYLSNRTWKQKLKVGALAAGPVLFLLALILAASTDLFHLRKADPFGRPAAETHKRLPDPKLTPAGVEVVDIKIVHDAHPPLVTGVVRNNTDHKVNTAEVSYYLAGRDGSVLSADTAGVSDLKPHDSVPFRTELKSPQAQFIIVRDVRAH